jgi:hypothetical protein
MIKTSRYLLCFAFLCTTLALAGCGTFKQPKLGDGGYIPAEREKELWEAVKRAIEKELGYDFEQPSEPEPQPGPAEPEPEPDVLDGAPQWPAPNPATGMSQEIPAGVTRSNTGLAKESLWDDGGLRGFALVLPSKWHGYIVGVTVGSLPCYYAPWSKPEHTNAWRPTYRRDKERMSQHVGSRVTVTLRNGAVFVSQMLDNSQRVDPLVWTKVN